MIGYCHFKFPMQMLRLKRRTLAILQETRNRQKYYRNITGHFIPEEFSSGEDK